MARDTSDDIENLQNGDSVKAQLEGEVVDTMESHEGVIRMDVEGQKVEVVSDEIVDIEQPARPVDITECDEDE